MNEKLRGPEANRGAQQTQMGGGGGGGGWIQQLLLIIVNHPLLVYLSSSLVAVRLCTRRCFHFLFSSYLHQFMLIHPHISVKVSILDWTVQDRLVCFIHACSSVHRNTPPSN